MMLCVYEQYVPKFMCVCVGGGGGGGASHPDQLMVAALNMMMKYPGLYYCQI